MASVERIRTSIKPLRIESSQVEGASRIIEVERIIMHDGFGYYYNIPNNKIENNNNLIH